MPRAERVQIKDSEDGYVALLILALILGLAVAVGLYLWKSNKQLLGQPAIKVEPFVPPKDREEYRALKAKLNPNNPEDVEKLKKHLMHRAMNAVPLVLSLQSDGTSIERLYKKGMLTDDMYDRVNHLKSYWEEEYQDVMNEADEFKDGMGQEIWPLAVKYFHLRVQHMEEQNAAEAQRKQDAAQFKAPSPGTPGTPGMMPFGPGGTPGAGAAGGPVARGPGSQTTSPAPTSAAAAPLNAAQLEQQAKRAEQLQKELLEEEERARAAGTPQTKAGGGGKTPGSGKK